MAYTNKDGFDFLCDKNGKPEAFVLKGVSLQKELEYINQHEIKAIYLNGFDSKKIENLNFLENVKFIEKVNLNGLDIDYSGLYNLAKLKYATINIKNKKQHLDYSIFKSLEYLSIDWYRGFPNLLNNLNLKELIIWKYKPKSGSLSELELPRSLERFEVTDSSILNFSGLDLPALLKLEAHYCNNLENLSGIENFKTSLEVLILDYCKKVQNYENLIFCNKLKKIIIGNCSKIPTINWVCQMPNLRFFSFYNTDVVDGDVSCCKNLDYASFNNKKHYSHTIEDIRQMQSARIK